ncbi:helicase [Streptomyces malaysiensis]|uniref:Helicase n=1 Tax=Streptomyces malaysiensis TaxID=92644 RepID=A0A7X6AUC3_STRMQ|nr:helicase [Streptomyces malaysiensis]
MCDSYMPVTAKFDALRGTGELYNGMISRAAVRQLAGRGVAAGTAPPARVTRHCRQMSRETPER